MEAFLAENKVYVIAASKPDALARLKVWRSLAIASGFDPGSGRVTTVKPEELPTTVLAELQKARERVEGPASAHARLKAIEAIASHFDDDLGFGEELVRSIEEHAGELPAALAAALAAGQKSAVH